MTRRWGRLTAALLVLTVPLAACSDDDDDDAAEDTTTTTEGDTEVTLTQGGDLLATIQERGTLRCGTRDALPGFAVLTPEGDHVGFDADFCRVIAAAILGDAEAVEFVDLATEARFTALQSGEIDVLVRNTTWTAGRDGSEGATFLQPNFYDGQGMMVAADAPVPVRRRHGRHDDLRRRRARRPRATSPTSSPASASPPAEVLSFPEPELIQEAFLAGRCDGWSSDVSQLTGLRSDVPRRARGAADPRGRVLEGAAGAGGGRRRQRARPGRRVGDLRHHPGRGVRHRLDEHRRVQRQRRTRTSGPSSARARRAARSIPGLGLPADFAVQVITQVGNYGEIFEEHLAPLGLERGVNTLWTDGGLLYAPPYR